MEKISGMVQMGIGVITFVVGILSIYFRIKYLVKEQGKEIEALKIKLETEIENREKDMRELLEAFRDGLKVEVNHITVIMSQQKESLDKLWGRVDNIDRLIGRIDEKLDSHIKNQERICKLNHNSKN